MFLLLRMDSVHVFILLSFVSLWCSFSVMEFWKASILWRSVWICISLHVLVFQIRPEAIQKLFSMGCLQRLWNLHKQIEKNKGLKLFNINILAAHLYITAHTAHGPRLLETSKEIPQVQMTPGNAQEVYFAAPPVLFLKFCQKMRLALALWFVLERGSWMQCVRIEPWHTVVLYVIIQDTVGCFHQIVFCFVSNSFSLSILVDSIVCWLCPWHPRLQFLGLLLLRRLRFGFAV